MALKLSNSIPELLRCRILVVVCELVMVRFISTPLSQKGCIMTFLSFFLFSFRVKMPTDTFTSPADTPIQARNWRIKTYASFTC